MTVTGSFTTPKATNTLHKLVFILTLTAVSQPLSCIIIYSGLCPCHVGWLCPCHVGWLCPCHLGLIVSILFGAECVHVTWGWLCSCTQYLWFLLFLSFHKTLCWASLYEFITCFYNRFLQDKIIKLYLGCWQVRLWCSPMYHILCLPFPTLVAVLCPWHLIRCFLCISDKDLNLK